MKHSWVAKATLVAFVVCGAAIAIAGPDQPTKFTNQGTIANTRHNLTQRPPNTGPLGPINAALMDPSRNDYGEVCVYCHTPHGGDSGLQAPLWNRTRAAGPYQTYDLLQTTTLTQPVTNPGPNSLTCLSCHDGTVAIDSIINMPGSGGPFNRYKASQITSSDETFLDSWTGVASNDHQKLSLGSNSCLGCHAPGGVFNAATDFTVFVIGQDLRNDHPVGIRFPAGSPDFNQPGGTAPGGTKFFDLDADGRMDKGEVRLYDTTDGPEVECASCHDPHGVPSSGPGTVFNPTFLRVANNIGSSLCLTCHIK